MNAFDQFDANPFDRFDAGASGQDRAQAAASGFNKGIIADLAGLPVSTAVNVWDLLKAGAGVVGKETGLLKGDLPEMTDRSKVVMSPEWIAEQFKRGGLSGVIEPNRPDDQASRLLHAGGQGASMALAMPQSGAQAVGSAIAGAAGTTAGQAAGEAGLGPAAQIAATALVPAGLSSMAARAGSANAAAQVRAKQTQPARDNINEAMDAGYVFPPSQTNPSMVNKLIGGLSGKAATEQAASIKNQDVTNRLVRQGLGLPEDAPLTVDTLSAVRKSAGTDYDAVKSFGAIQADAPYVRSLVDLNNSYLRGAGGFESLKVPAVERLIQDAAQPGFSSESAVELVKRLRADADAGYRRGGPGELQVARAQKGVANSIEDLIERNLQSAGANDLFDAFQSARQRIAKSYDVQDALNVGTGNVDARKLASKLQAGKPLTDELRSVATAGKVSPRSTREMANETPPGVSVLDYAMAAGPAIAGAATGHPAAAASIAWPAARMGARALALSGPFQRFMARPSTGGSTSQMLSALAPGEATIPLITAEGSDQSRRILADALRRYGKQMVPNAAIESFLGNP